MNSRILTTSFTSFSTYHDVLDRKETSWLLRLSEILPEKKEKKKKKL